MASFAIEKVAGQLIFNNGSSLDVTFLISMNGNDADYLKLQHKVKYLNRYGEKLEVRPDEAKEIRFQWGKQTIRMLSRYNNLPATGTFPSSSKIFLKLEMEGELSLYSFYYTLSTGQGSSSVRQIAAVFQKKGGNIFAPVNPGYRADPKLFNNQMKSYFKDCPEMVEKFNKEEFKIGQYSAMVVFYNSNCVE